MKHILLFFALLILATCAAAQIPDLYVLVPEAGPCQEESILVPMYAGPTVNYDLLGDTVIDPSKPYVFFGQTDSWSMAAQGTPEEWTNAGWVPTAALPVPLTPELDFSDRLAAMIEEDTTLLSTPDGPESTLLSLPYGTEIAILARWNEFLYIEVETQEHLLRGFVPESAVE